MLDDLVASLFRASADNRRGSGRLLDGDGIFADVLEPDVKQAAGAQAVDTCIGFSLVSIQEQRQRTFLLVGADDDIPKRMHQRMDMSPPDYLLESSSILNQEYSIGIASFAVLAGS